MDKMDIVFFFVWLFELVNLKVWVDNLGFSAVFVASLPSVSVNMADLQSFDSSHHSLLP